MNTHYLGTSRVPRIHQAIYECDTRKVSARLHTLFPAFPNKLVGVTGGRVSRVVLM